MEKMLSVRDLRTYFYSSGQIIPAVDGVSFDIDRGETVGVVGESGCGKSVTSLSIMKLVPVPPGKYVSGSILFEGQDLVKKSVNEMRKIRGNDIAMIFQEPMTSLNPVQTIGFQIMEGLRLHQNLRRREAQQKAEHMLSLVNVPDPHRRIKEYPHQLSGGMRQRAMIAMALSCNPKLLIADEPTTALDVTVQAQILELIKGLKQELNMSIMLITHDMGVIAEMAERVVVMYAGKVVEQGKATELFNSPLHPYTEGLLTCIPTIDRPRGKLNVIKGIVPNPAEFPPGCRFHPRCSYVQEICKKEEPPLVEKESRQVACYFSDSVRGKGVA